MGKVVRAGHANHGHTQHMGKVVRYRPPNEQSDWTASIGMVVFLGSWAMMFGSLFFAYGILRAHAVLWPPPDLPRLPRLVPGIATLVLALSSYAVRQGNRALGRDRVTSATRLVGSAAGLGLGFLALQAVVWTRLLDLGFTPQTGGYASVFYLFTGFHAAHVVIGLGALVWLTARLSKGNYNAARHLPVRLWTMYWHFVGVVWLLMFATLYWV